MTDQVLDHMEQTTSGAEFEKGKSGWCDHRLHVTSEGWDWVLAPSFSAGLVPLGKCATSLGLCFPNCKM